MSIDTATVTDPGRTISVTTVGGYTTNITITPAALYGSEADLATKIRKVASFSSMRCTANMTDRLTAERVTEGDDEIACRRYFHRELGWPSQEDVDAAYAIHYADEQ